MSDIPVGLDVPAVLNLLEGSEVFYDKRRWVILRVQNLASVLARSLEGEPRETRPIDVHALLPVPSGQDKVITPDVDLVAVTDDQWEMAKKRLESIKPLLERPRNSTALARKNAQELGVTLGTLYLWRNKYLISEKVSALLDTPRPGGKGKGRLNAQVEGIMLDAITDIGEMPSEVSIKQTFEDICTTCQQKQLSAPALATFRLRIEWYDQRRLFEKRRGRKAAVSRFDPLKVNTIRADGPLKIVEIDHCVVNVIVVHEVTRQPIYRPWLTIAIDVHTRVVAGIYLSLDHPSTTSVAACLAHAILPKEDYLRRLGATSITWPVWGKMDTLHMDNGADFRGERLKPVLTEYRIERQFRPVKKPQYGAHIERLIGTFSKRFDILPGATMNKPPDKDKEYFPEAAASMTMLELEKWFVEEINKYHHRAHTGIDGQTPLERLEHGLLRADADRPAGLPPRRMDPERVRIDFLPEVLRTIQRGGVEYDGRIYWSDVLTPWIGVREKNDPKKKPLYRFKTDDRAINTIFFWDERQKQYFRIPSVYTAAVDASRTEYRAMRKELKAAGNGKPAQHEVFDSIVRQRAIVEQAIEKTAQAKKPAKPRKTHKKVLKQNQQQRDNQRRREETKKPPQAAPTFALPSIDDLPPIDGAF